MEAGMLDEFAFEREMELRRDVELDAEIRYAQGYENYRGLLNALQNCWHAKVFFGLFIFVLTVTFVVITDELEAVSMIFQ